MQISRFDRQTDSAMFFSGDFCYCFVQTNDCLHFFANFTAATDKKYFRLNCYFLVYFERSSESQTCATSSHRTGWSLLETTFYSEFTLWQATQIHQTLFLFSFFAGLSQFHLRFFWPFLLLPLLQSSYSLLDSCNATTRNCVLIFTLGEQYKLKTSLLSQTDFRVIGRIHSVLFFDWSEIFNPIPTGLCHVITVYVLIQPMAGKNRVKGVINEVWSSWK